MNIFKIIGESFQSVYKVKGIKTMTLALIALFLLGNFYFAGNSVLIAQANKKDAKKTTETKKADKKETKKAGTKKGKAGSKFAEASKFRMDPTSWVLVCLFGLATAVAIERSIYMTRNKGKNAELVNILTHGLSENSEDLGELIEKVSERKYGMEGRVAAKTLQGWHFGDKAMNEFAKAAMQAEERGLDSRLVVLSTLGNNTPFIGLLGTVLGIMKAFRDLALIGDAGPAVVMKGISEALTATAFGLGVAIPCVIAFNIFSKKMKGKMSNATEIVNMLTGIRTAFESQGQTGVQKIAGSQGSGQIPQGDAAPESV